MIKNTNIDDNVSQETLPPAIEDMLRQFQKDIAEKHFSFAEEEEPEAMPSLEMPSQADPFHSYQRKTQSSQPDTLQIKSESYLDFVNIQPRFFEKWGIAIIAGVIALGLVTCCFIKYPEIVEGKIIVQSVNAPKALIPNINGKVVRVLRSNNEKIAKGESIIYLESTANHEEVLSTYQRLEQLTTNIDKIDKLDLTLFENQASQFGELQSQIQSFKQSYLNYKDNQNSGIYEKKRTIIQSDIQILKKQIENVNNQKKGAEEELKYSEEKAKMNETLYKSKVIARDEYNGTQASYVAKKNSLMQFASTKLSYEAQINQKNRELMELEQQAKNQRTLFIESLNTLKSQFDEWINKYIVKAPVGGTLIYTSFIQENQLLQAGKPVGLISPQNSNSYVAMAISQNVFPKVKLNQRVILKLTAYPVQDYGYINGYIDYISPQLNDSCFLAKVRCTNGFTTSQKVSVNMKHGMTGVGEIIVKDKTIMGRMFSKLTEKFRMYQ